MEINYLRHLLGLEAIIEEHNCCKHCPNCGKKILNHIRFETSTIKTPWGGSTLYGVCGECRAAHELMGKILNQSNKKKEWKR